MILVIKMVSFVFYKIESKWRNYDPIPGRRSRISPELKIPKAERAINNIEVWIIFMPGSRVKPRIPITSKRAKWAIQRSHQRHGCSPYPCARKTSKNSNWLDFVLKRWRERGGGRSSMLKIKRLVIDRFVHGRHAIETFWILISGSVLFLSFSEYLTFNYFNLF